MGEVSLALRGFGVAFGERVILAHVDLSLPRKGMTVLVGPAGAGKSTLLRTIAGLNHAHPTLHTWGSAELEGRPLGCGDGERDPRVGAVAQHARFFLDTVRENLVGALPDRAALDRSAQTSRIRARLEAYAQRGLLQNLNQPVASLPTGAQRIVAIVKAMTLDPPLLVVDEPSAGLSDDERDQIGGLLRRLARERAVLLVSHHQLFARSMGGQTALLAGGRIRHVGPTEAFFDAPPTPLVQSFVRTGGCALPSPDAKPEELAGPPPSLPPPPLAKSRFLGPRHFLWLKPGRLGGLPRPGIVEPLQVDLERLKRLGVTVLVTLEERPTVDPAALAAYGIRSIHAPIDDMRAPPVHEAHARCQEVARLLREGEVVALHCRAGLGRTGTMLAAQLIEEGASSRAALDKVRELNPKFVQSEIQVRFLAELELFLGPQKSPGT